MLKLMLNLALPALENIIAALAPLIGVGLGWGLPAQKRRRADHLA